VARLSSTNGIKIVQMMAMTLQNVHSIFIATFKLHYGPGGPADAGSERSGSAKVHHQGEPGGRRPRRSRVLCRGREVLIVPAARAFAHREIVQASHARRHGPEPLVQQFAFGDPGRGPGRGDDGRAFHLRPHLPARRSGRRLPSSRIALTRGALVPSGGCLRRTHRRRDPQR